MKFFTLFIALICLNSCKSYVDVNNSKVSDKGMNFNFYENFNSLDYFSSVNASADNDIFYTTHFTINLPKKIVYWEISSNNFFFEYDSKQIIYIYSSYKNKGQESENWELKDIDYNEVLKYIGEYWDKRNYNENYLYEAHNERVSKLYTNGKYKILLYNVKTENLQAFIQSAKTFNTNH